MKKNIAVSFLLLLLLQFSFFLTMNAQDLRDVQFEEIRDIGTGVFLTWKIPLDQNIDQIFLERSSEKMGFEVVESFSQKNKNEVFTFFDQTLGIKKVKYRLRCVSLEKGTFYSKEIFFEKKINSIYRLASKELISENYFKLTLEAIAFGELDFTLRNNFGEIVFNQTWKVNSGLNEFFINLADVPNGSYSGILKGGQQVNTIGFEKKNRKETGVAVKKNGEN